MLREASMQIHIGADELILRFRKNSRAVGRTNDKTGNDIFDPIQHRLGLKQ